MTERVIASDFRAEKKNVCSPAFLTLRGKNTDGKYYADECIGWEKEDGGLSTKWARERIEGPSGPIQLSFHTKKTFFHWYEEDGIKKKTCFCYADDGYMYRFTNEWNLLSSKMAFPEQPDCFSYRSPAGGDYFFASGLERTYRFLPLTRTYYLVDSVPPSFAAAVHYERLFIIDRNKRESIRFSRALDVTDWQEGVQASGRIEIPSDKGWMIGLLSFASQLYIVREHGFTRLTAMGDNRNFTVKTIEVDCGNIRKDGFLACGEYIVFLTDQGLFRFNGNQADQIASEWTKMLDFSSFGVPAAHGGRFFIGARTKEGKGVSLAVDPATGETSLLPFYGEVFASSGEELVCEGEDRQLYFVKEKETEDGDLSIWRSEDMDFGLDGRKVLKSFTVRAEGEYELTISSESRTFCKKGKGTTKFSPRLPGEKFTVCVRASRAKLFGWEATINEY